MREKSATSAENRGHFTQCDIHIAIDFLRRLIERPDHIPGGQQTIDYRKIPSLLNEKGMRTLDIAKAVGCGNSAMNGFLDRFKRCDRGVSVGLKGQGHGRLKRANLHRNERATGKQGHKRQSAFQPSVMDGSSDELEHHNVLGFAVECFAL